MVKVNSRTIQRLLQGHGQFIREADEARRYYSNVNRIKQDNSVLQRQAETEQTLGNPLHPNISISHYCFSSGVIFVSYSLIHCSICLLIVSRCSS